MMNWLDRNKKSRKPPTFRGAYMVALALTVVSVGGAGMIGSVMAQTSTAEIEGTIVDPTGAVVPDATVITRNTDTGLTRETISGGNGHYSLPLLPIGHYELTVEKQGFQKKVLQGITLEIDQIARIEVPLEVGPTSEEVTIVAQTPLINAANATIGDVIENRRVVGLPLNGRYFIQLALLVSGSTPGAQSGAFQQWASNSGGFGFSVAGQRETQNNFNLDGVTLMEHFIDTISVNPSIDVIKEFKVSQNSYSAEGGLFSGAQVNITTKSGTNEFHGTVYHFFRNDELDAKNFFDDPDSPIPEFKQNQFGGAFGGPLSRDRTFFFLNYEGLRVRKAITNLTLLPTAEMRAGDLSGINPATGDPFPQIIDPDTGAPFPGNVIPPDRVDPLSRAILGLLPLPNRPGAVGLNHTNVGKRRQNSDQFTIRIDHRLNDRNHILARFTFNNSILTIPFVRNLFAFNPPAPPGFGDEMDDFGRNLALGLTTTISTNLVNEFRFGFNRFRGTKESQNVNRHFIQSLGFKRGGPTMNFGVPAISLPGYADIGDGDIFQPINRLSNIFQTVDNLVWIKDRHSHKFGADYRRIQRRDAVEDFSQGLFLFNEGPVPLSASGSAFSDFLVGRPFISFSFAGDSIGHDRSNYLGVYYNDEYRVTRRFTLTLGLRYEFLQAPADRFGEQSIANPMNSNQFFVRTQDGHLPHQINDPLNQRYVREFGFEFIPSEAAGFPRALVDTDYLGFAPRVGLAWDLLGTGKTVIRAGYGIYNAIGQLDFAIETRQSPPFVSFPFGLDLARFSAPLPPLTFQQAFLGGNEPPQFLSTLPNLRNGYVHQWSLDIQQELAPNLVLEAQYIGSTGVKLTRRTIGNQPLPNLPHQRRGAPPFPGQEFFSRTTDATSSYQGFVLRLERRFSQGLSFVAAYTLSKSLDTLSTLQGSITLPQDSLNLRAERGRSDFDTRQRFVVSPLWEIPLGKGKRWLQSGTVSRILGGWQIGGVLTLQSGQPTTAQLSTSNNGTGNNAAGSARPDVIGDPNLPPSQRDPSRWFNTSAFVAPPTFVDDRGPFQLPGNAGRNIIDGPGFKDLDLMIQKVSAITETHRITFRAEFFNLTNHPNFDLPGQTFGTATFGVINSAKSSRVIQFSLRYAF